MNPEAEEQLKKILSKEPRTLTVGEIQFLKARISYVGKNSRAKFKDVLAQDVVDEVQPEPEPNPNPFPPETTVPDTDDDTDED